MAYAISTTNNVPHGDSWRPPLAATRDAATAPSSPEPDNTSPRNPATVVSLSPEAWSALQPDRPELPQHEAPAPRDLGKIMEASRIEMELAKLDALDNARAANTETLHRFQATYTKLRDTPPKPAKILDEEGKERVLKLLEEGGLVLTIPKDGTFGFGKDGVIYMFRSDGTVTAEEDGVATSSKVQQRSLARYADMISWQQNLLRDTSSERAALLASRAALQGDEIATN